MATAAACSNRTIHGRRRCEALAASSSPVSEQPAVQPLALLSVRGSVARLADRVAPARPADNADWCRSWRRPSSRQSAIASDVEAQVTMNIPTMGSARLPNLIKALRSIRQHYPRISILVGDSRFGEGMLENMPLATLNAERQALRQSVLTHAQWQGELRRLMPQPSAILRFDGNVSTGQVRNTLVAASRTPYVLIGDDDFIFDNTTRVEALLSLTWQGDVDIVAGKVVDSKCARHSRTCGPQPAMLVPTRSAGGGSRHGWLFCHDPAARGFRLTSDLHPSCVRTSWVRQFFLARTVVLQGSGWDDAVGSIDHFHCMWRLRLANARMLWCDDLCVVRHNKAPTRAAYVDGAKGFADPAAWRAQAATTIRRNAIAHSASMWHLYKVEQGQRPADEVCNETANILRRQGCPGILGERVKESVAAL